MVPGIMNYFSRGSTTPAAVVEDPESHIRALPTSWYTSQETYELERRAIFSRKWLFITHRLRLAQAGDYLRYDIAGFQIVLARDREGNINGFHNVCRHRAYPVVAEEKGTARIFSCKYHGWSYGLNGKLAKAPGYQELSNFDKSANGLFPVHVHVDGNGFVWINLDGKDKPELSWEDEFGGIDKQPRLQDYDFDNYTYDHSWETEGAFNWKILADTYNERYRSLTAHSNTPNSTNLIAHSTSTSTPRIDNNTASTQEQTTISPDIVPTFFFPNTSTNFTSHFLVIQKIVPSGPETSTVRYEVFRSKSATDEEFEIFNQMYTRIMSEDKNTCVLAQKNFDADISIDGQTNTHLAQGSLLFQTVVNNTILNWQKRERDTNGEIWPARQKMSNEALKTKEDIEFCTGLACAPANQQGLAW